MDEEEFRDVMCYFNRYRQGGSEHVTKEQLDRIRDALQEQVVFKQGCSIDEKHQKEAQERNALVKTEVTKLRSLDPDGRQLLGKKQEAGWARRSRELSRDMKRADNEARDAMLRGDFLDPSAHGWDGASRCNTAIRFMKNWWTNYLYEDYPGMYDQAWRIVRNKVAKEGNGMPAENSQEADKVRAAVCNEIRTLAKRQHDTLRDRKFYKQIVSRDLTQSEVEAFKRSMILQGYVVACSNTRGWKWKSPEQTYKIVPRPGQNGHKELMDRFENECMRAPSRKR